MRVGLGGDDDTACLADMQSVGLHIHTCLLTKAVSCAASSCCALVVGRARVEGSTATWRWPTAMTCNHLRSNTAHSELQALHAAAELL